MSTEKWYSWPMNILKIAFGILHGIAAWVLIGSVFTAVFIALAPLIQRLWP